jgi:hypothetical protein
MKGAAHCVKYVHFVVDEQHPHQGFLFVHEWRSDAHAAPKKHAWSMSAAPSVNLFATWGMSAPLRDS